MAIASFHHSVNDTMNKEELEKTRFQREREFLSFLANPDYLRWLSDEGYFDDPRFIRYLKYMLYWKEENNAVSLRICIFRDNGLRPFGMS